MWGLHPTAAPPMAAGKPRLWLVSGTLGAHWGNGDILGEWGHIGGMGIHWGNGGTLREISKLCFFLSFFPALENNSDCLKLW